MGYDMYVADPDPVMAQRKSELYGLIYGQDGLLQTVKKLDEAGEASPKKEGKNPFEFYPFWEAYEDEGGSEEFHFNLTALKRLFAEHDTVESHTYFRLNIWGMGRCRDIMDERGEMVHYIGGHPEWPDLSDFGLDEYPEDVQYDDDYNEIGPWPDGSPEAQFVAARDAILAYSPPGVRGIPGWKLGSNDGWLVTEEDCKGALACLRDWAITQVDDPSDDAAVRAKMVESPIVRFDDGEGPVEWWEGWVTFLETASTHGGFRTH